MIHFKKLYDWAAKQEKKDNAETFGIYNERNDTNVLRRICDK